MNHKWSIDNVCVRCGLRRTRMSRHKEIAQAAGRIILQHSSAWYYGWPDKKLTYVVKTVGFKRPNCKPKSNDKKKKRARTKRNKSATCD